MNQWSDERDSRFFYQTTTSSFDENLYDKYDSESLTDVSSIMDTKSVVFNDNRTCSDIINESIEQQQNLLNYDHSIDDQFKTDNELYQSLMNYANSFNLDETFYSIIDMKNRLDCTNSIKKPVSEVIDERKTDKN